MTCHHCQMPGFAHHRLDISNGVPTRTYTCDRSGTIHPVTPWDAADELRGIAAQLDPAPSQAGIRPAWTPAEERAFAMAAFKADLAVALRAGGTRVIIPWLAGCLMIVITLGLGLAQVFEVMSRWFA
jgi:hypothetical protein